MSRSGTRRKHAADVIQLRRISHPASHPYKEDPHVRGSGASTQDAPEDKDKDKDQRIYHPAEDQAERLPGGVGGPWVGRTWPGSRPGALRGVAAKVHDHLPYMRWRETDL